MKDETKAADAAGDCGGIGGGCAGTAADSVDTAAACLNERNNRVLLLLDEMATV